MNDVLKIVNGPYTGPFQHAGKIFGRDSKSFENNRSSLRFVVQVSERMQNIRSRRYYGPLMRKKMETSMSMRKKV